MSLYFAYYFPTEKYATPIAKCSQIFQKCEILGILSLQLEVVLA